MRLWPRRKKERLRPLGEAECYGRAYGDRSAEVRTVKLEPRRPRYALAVSGEDLRRSFEQRLAARQEELG